LCQLDEAVHLAAQAGTKVVGQQAKDAGIAGVVHPGAGPRDEKGGVVGRQGIQPGGAAPDEGGQRQQPRPREAVVQVSPQNIKNRSDNEGHRGHRAHLGLVDLKGIHDGRREGTNEKLVRLVEQDKEKEDKYDKPAVARA